jgi:hypothetical protein
MAAGIVTGRPCTELACRGFGLLAILHLIISCCHAAVLAAQVRSVQKNVFSN